MLFVVYILIFLALQSLVGLNLFQICSQKPGFQFWMLSTDYLLYTPRSQIATHHVTRHNTPIHNIPSNAPQLSISHKALRTLPEDGNVIPKYVGATIHN
jgi:hypothetical protein